MTRPSERGSDRVTERVPETRLERPDTAFRDNRFEIDYGTIPTGMAVGWKRYSSFGQVDRRHQAICAQFHWRPVPAKLQPHLKWAGMAEDDAIIIDGQILMMRPAYLNDDAERERQAATAYMTQQEVLSLTARSKHDAPHATKLQRVFAPLSADDPQSIIP